MIPSCLRHTELPGTSRLFADFLYRFDHVGSFYRHNPWRAESYREAVRSLDYPAERRQALAAALREINEDSDALAKLASPGTVAVVTGQQVGLFSGPCYTIYKALTAVRLAAKLEADGIPAVPVFWLATEDHDFAEVNHAWCFDARQTPVLHTVPANGGGHRPVGGIAVANFPVDGLRRALAEFPFGEEVSAAVAESYSSGRTMGDAFLALLKRLLPGMGLLYLDPMQPAIREIAAPLLARAVERDGEMTARLLARSRELEAAGYHAQVHFEEKTSFFFSLEGGERVTLRRAGDRYGPYSRAELAARAGHLSPNALLRPVVQDYVLPTVVQIGGPAEIAYLAQTQVLYDVLDRPAPVVAPRGGFTLLDARAAKLLERYGLSVTDCAEGLDPLREKIAARLVPPALRERMQGTRTVIENALEALRGELAAFDPTLAASLDKSRAKIRHQAAKISGKTARECLRRDARAEEEASYLSRLLFHDRHPQERIYTILPFLARHGPDLVGRLRESVSLECPDHLVLTL